MQQTGERVTLSPTDLSAFLACRHLTRLELSVARGERKRPVFEDPHRTILFEKGQAHEKMVLAALRRSGRKILEAPTYGPGFDAEAARRLTEEALQAGVYDIIYQPYFEHEGWRGFADFVERGEDGIYEPIDAKLARSARSEHVLQLCYYAEQVQRIQGRLPKHIHVQLGSGERETFETADFMAYFRRVRSRFLAEIEAAPPTYPWPCDLCSICSWRRECDKQLKGDDNLVLVAGLGRTVVPDFVDAGFSTLQALGEAKPGTFADGIPRKTFEGFRHQAALQLYHRREKKHRFDLLPREEGRGFHLLPEPSPGDVWLDLEGHPFYEPARGLEYLIGYCTKNADGTLTYEARWAKDRRAEKEVFENFVDWMVERRRQHPGMHIYHYANYERSALLRLMGEHGTRENEIDELLRAEVLIDLYRVTRQALRASVESYSIKKVEALYDFKREAEVKGGAESTVIFEEWLNTQDASLLEEIAKYNEEDCRSAAALHAWLLSIRPKDMEWRPAPDPAEGSDKARTASETREKIKAELLARSQAEGDTPWLLAQLLDYHQRNARPEWWHWFNRLEMDDEELTSDTSTMGGLEPVGVPFQERRSLVYTFSFPEQDHKIDGKAADPVTKRTHRVEVDNERGIVRLWRGTASQNDPLPRALTPQPPIDETVQKDALARFATSYLAGDHAYAALTAVLERREPRVDLTLAPPEAALTLDGSYLFVQGPPGSGKTWQGAKAAVALMRAGKRIGVTSQSHRSINKLLGEIEREAEAQSFSFRGRKKHTDEDDAHRGPFIDSSGKPDDLRDRSLQLIAGTSWLFARPEFNQTLDVLFIDEAGQFALADALASGTSACNLVLLGDPNQLSQVSQGVQPEAAKSSVLKHLLGEHMTVPPDRGIFLKQTWRLRPELCAFNSEAYYDSRLEPAELAKARSLSIGNGLSVIAVHHEGRGQSSREEAEAVLAEVGRLIGTPFTDGKRTRPLEAKDILVVAPYNAQVRTLRAALPPDVRVGTVDKFQGQEAVAVLVSFASSSGADAPRGIQFAFDSHRVNVATSRGQCRVVLVCAPELLQAECRSIEQMKLMNAICRFVELAEKAKP